MGAPANATRAVSSLRLFVSSLRLFAPPSVARPLSLRRSASRSCLAPYNLFTLRPSLRPWLRRLYPTLVMEADGAALGLVYSSAASIAAAVRCGRGVYWSRSRGSLWRKGDTSGAWQTLRSIRLDCDADALCFTVTQHGEPQAFCHKSSLSCWGPPAGLHALQMTLRQRKLNAPPESYTKRLFNDSTLLRNKLVEEAQELAEATEHDEVASECADVLYFAMVRCVAAGVDWKDVCKSLDLKALKLARRPGNDKKEYASQSARKQNASKQNARSARARSLNPLTLLPSLARTTQAHRCSREDSRREEGRRQA